MSILPLNEGGTGSDLSGTGGAGQVVKQTSAGADLSVAAIATSDLPTSGTWPFGGTVSGSPSITGELHVGNINNIIFVDGVTYTSIQAAINAIAMGGNNSGTVLIPPGTWTGPTSIPNNTRLVGLAPGWGFEATGNKVVLQYSSTLTLTNLINCQFENLVFDFLTLATSGAGLVLTANNSNGNAFCVQNLFRYCTIMGGGTSVPVLSLTASGSGGTISTNFNAFEHIIISGNTNTSGSNQGPALCGVYLNGAGTVDGGPAVTQNIFTDLFIRGGLIGGVDIEKNCDTNIFYKTSILQEWAGSPNPL
jgi:hypothetical protein